MTPAPPPQVLRHPPRHATPQLLLQPQLLHTPVCGGAPRQRQAGQRRTHLLPLLCVTTTTPAAVVVQVVVIVAPLPPHCGKPPGCSKCSSGHAPIKHQSIMFVTPPHTCGWRPASRWRTRTRSALGSTPSLAHTTRMLIENVEALRLAEAEAGGSRAPSHPESPHSKPKCRVPAKIKRKTGSKATSFARQASKGQYEVQRAFCAHTHTLPSPPRGSVSFPGPPCPLPPSTLHCCQRRVSSWPGSVNLVVVTAAAAVQGGTEHNTPCSTEHKHWQEPAVCALIFHDFLVLHGFMQAASECFPTQVAAQTRGCERASSTDTYNASRQAGPEVLT